MRRCWKSLLRPSIYVRNARQFSNTRCRPAAPVPDHTIGVRNINLARRYKVGERISAEEDQQVK